MRLASELQDARRAGRTIVLPYLMVDRARLRELPRVVAALRAGGATGLELGFPFSDPIADGPILESAHERSLQDGTRWGDLLAALQVTTPVLPTAVMTYANPLVHRGLDSAIGDLAAAGATGLIVPDLSLEESGPFRAAATHLGVSVVLMGAPGIRPSRLSRIANASRGFLYLVSHYGTTGGVARGSTVDLRPLVVTARRAAPSLPILVGFGVRDRTSSAHALASGADGVIVGSALEEQLRRDPRAANLTRFISAISRAPRSTVSRTA